MTGQVSGRDTALWQDLRAHGAVILPGLRNLILLKLAQSARVGHAAGQIGADDFLREAQATDFVFPVRDVCRVLCQLNTP